MKSNVLLWQTGSGTHEARLKDERGSQPPRQYAPTPHCPYSLESGCQLVVVTRKGRCCEGNSREQHGVSWGHRLLRSHDGGAARAMDAVATTARSAEARTIVNCECGCCDAECSRVRLEDSERD